MLDLRRAAALLKALADGVPLSQAAEQADFDLEQAREALQDLAYRLNRQGRHQEEVEAAEHRRMEKAKQVAAGCDDLVFVFDGGSRGNPGPAAGVAIALDANGESLVERSRFLDKNTNNVAEYHGLLLAIDLAREMGVKRLLLQGDSELVVKQLRGEYKVKNKNILPLFLAAVRALREFPHWEVRHIRREENRLADDLVNRVLDERAPRVKIKKQAALTED